MIDVVTKVSTQIVADGELPEFNALGDRIVFMRDGEIWSTDLTGTIVEQLSFGPKDDHPSWE